MSKRKIYVDFTDCGRGCMPSVYDVPNENTVEYEEKNESAATLGTMYTTNHISPMLVGTDPAYPGAVYTTNHVSLPDDFRIHTAYGPVNTQQIEELASWFFRETGYNPEHIATYLARRRQEVPF